jgi:putative oxidoreductase
LTAVVAASGFSFQETSMAKFSPILLSVLRIVTGLLFVFHGTTKVLGWPHPPMHEGGGAHPAPSHIMAVLAQSSGYFELIGGILILIGLFTRVTGFILSGEMAVAYFMAHAPNGLYPIDNHGEIAVLYCFVFLYLSGAGAGPISVDRIIKRA